MGRFLVTLRFSTLESFLPLYERLFCEARKHHRCMSPQSLSKLICGLTRCQESSGIPQTLTLTKSLRKILVFDININLKWFRGISKLEKHVRSFLATVHVKLDLVMNWVKLISQCDNLTFHVNVCNLILLFFS